MNFVEDNVKVMSGEVMLGQGLLDPAAEEVSKWLKASEPHTNPRTVEELIEHADNSLYATIDGHAIGHVGVELFAEPVEIEVGANRGSPVLMKLPHSEIKSLVVNPRFAGAGLGIGSFLVGEACEKAANLNPGQHHDRFKDGLAPLAVVSAVACSNSIPTFNKFGFKSATQLDIVNVFEGFDPYSQTDKIVMSIVLVGGAQ